MTKCQEFPIWFCFYIIMMPFTLLMQSIKEIYGGSSSVVSVTDLVFDFTVAAPKDWPQEAAAVHNQTVFRFFFNFQKLNLVWFPSSELLDYNNQAFGPILAPKTRSCWSVTKKKKKKINCLLLKYKNVISGGVCPHSVLKFLQNI